MRIDRASPQCGEHSKTYTIDRKTENTKVNDRTADRVVAELGRRGEAVTRFDVADFPCRVSINAELQDKCGWRGWVKTEDG